MGISNHSLELLKTLTQLNSIYSKKMISTVVHFLVGKS